MEISSVRVCPCGTRLARDNRRQRCARCQQRARDLTRPLSVPDGFWATAEMRQALATRHMGQVVRAFRTHPFHGEPISQSRAARWLNVTQTQLSRLETGRPPDSLTKLTHVAHTLGLPPALLWFEMPDRVSDTTTALVPTPAEPDAEDLAWDCDRSEAPTVLPPVSSGADDWFDDMNRRELLRLLSLAGPVTGLAGLADGPLLGDAAPRPRGVDGADLDDYANLNAHLWQVFILSRSKSAVFPLVKSHLDTLTTSLQQPQSSQAHRQLCVLVAELFQLAGEICFDANRYTEAAHCYTLAASACREAETFDLWACALVRHAFIALHERAYDQAPPLLELAARLAHRGDPGLSTRHWVAAVQAQTFASLGQTGACQRALDAAQQVHELDGAVHNGGWLRFDGSRLAEERGSCYVALRRPDLAESALTAALDQSLSTRRRGSVLVDLALVAAQRDDPDQVLTYALPALDTARDTGSGYLARRLHELHAQLGPLRANYQVRQLDEQILTVVGRGISTSES